MLGTKRAMLMLGLLMLTSLGSCFNSGIRVRGLSIASKPMITRITAVHLSSDSGRDDSDGASGSNIDIWKEQAMTEVWEYRENFARGSFRTLVNWKEDERERMNKRLKRREAGGSAGEEATKSAFIASAAAVVLGALILRVGGRAALVSVVDWMWWPTLA